MEASLIARGDQVEYTSAKSCTKILRQAGEEKPDDGAIPQPDRYVELEEYDRE